MCKELIKEIEESKNLGRIERRKKERQLQKKYKDATIRIKFGIKFTKSASLDRKQQRQILKDKNLLNELRKIIKK